MSTVLPRLFSKAESNKRQWLEFAATLVLALGSLVTSWSGYQSSLWSSIAATNYQQAEELRQKATREANFGGQLASVDAAMLMGWVNAYATGHDELQRIYRDRFRPEFRQAFEAWSATQPFSNPRAPSSPFEMSDYRREHTDRALQLDSQAAALVQAGRQAARYAHTYLLGTVAIATVLFFCGIAHQFQDFRARITLVGLATLLLVLALSRILGVPRA